MDEWDGTGWDGSGQVGTSYNGSRPIVTGKDRSARGNMRSEVDRERVEVDREREEVEVIRTWLTGVLKGTEGEELEVIDFCFYPLEVAGRERKERMVRPACPQPPGRAEEGHGGGAGGGGAEVLLPGGEGDPAAPTTPQVLPTEDLQRYTRARFRQVLRFSKEVEVYTRLVAAMARSPLHPCTWPPLASLPPYLLTSLHVNCR